MKYREEIDVCTNDRKIFLELDLFDISMARLDKWDRHLLAECEKSNSIADKLLALECVVRRIEETK